MKVLFYTIFALVAFAGNSVLCRLALGEGGADAASFTALRLFSAIVVLAIILKITQGSRAVSSKGSWCASLMLFLYVTTFSFAYLSLETGVGALILFGAVQMTMILMGLYRGDRLHLFEWLGVIVALSGLVYLLIPSLGTPSLIGFLLMTLSGIAWGFYTLLGRGSENPLHDTAYNFFRTLPLIIILITIAFQNAVLSQKGIILAVLSGGFASAIGYTVWYMALKRLSITQAAVVQLLVPVIAAIGGVIFAHERLSLELIISSLTILSGIMAVVLGRHFSMQQAAKKI